MLGVNKVILVGNVGKDPEVRYLEGGIATAKFSLATNETYTNKEGNKVDQTEWHNIVLWRKSAEIAEKYVRKGSLVCIEGKIKSRTWEDKDGNKRYAIDIVGDSMTLLGSKKEDTNSNSNTVSTPQSAAEPSNTAIPAAQPADDLPF